MQQVLFKIREGIYELFPAAMGFEIVPDTLLNRIPDWDSMSSVNFKVFLEETFKVLVPEDLLEGSATIAEIIAHIGSSN